MPVEIVQFCWKYNVGRLQNLPEVGIKGHDATLPAMLFSLRLGISQRDDGRCISAQVAGCTAKLRENKDGSPYVTDNENYIVRISSPPLYACIVTDRSDDASTRLHWHDSVTV